MLHVADDVLQHDDGVIHDETHRQGEGHQGDVVHRKAKQVHRGKGTDDGNRQRQAGNEGGGDVAQKQEDDQDHQGNRQNEGELDLRHRLADRVGAVVHDLEIHRAGQLLAESGQLLFDVVDDLDGVGAGLALNRQNDRPGGLFLGVEPCGNFVVFDAVGDVGDVPQAHRRATPVDHDELLERLGVVKLAVDLDREGLARPLQPAGGQVDVPTGQGRLHLVQADVTAGQLQRVEADPHGVFLRTVDVDLGHPVDHRDARGDDRVGKLVDLGKRQGRRGHGQVENRSIGRVDLADRGRTRHLPGELPGGLGDGRLHVLGGRVDIPLQGELDGDDRGSLAVGGTERVDAGNRRELALQGGGDGAGHGFRAGAGETGPHLDGREIDARQVVDRQQPIGEGAEDHDRQHD